MKRLNKTRKEERWIWTVEPNTRRKKWEEKSERGENFTKPKERKRSKRNPSKVWAWWNTEEESYFV